MLGQRLQHDLLIGCWFKLRDSKFKDTKVSTTIIQIVTGLGIGGAERVVLQLAGYLEKNDYHVVVLALNGDRSILTQYQNNIAYSVHSLHVERTPLSVLRAILALIKLSRTEKAEVIHAHMFHGLLAGLLCRLARPQSKLVFTSHSTAGFSSLRKSLIFFTKAFRAADIVFMQQQHTSLNVSKTYVIPNGVPVQQVVRARQKEKRDRRIFLFVGRLEIAKNPVGLVNVFASMKHQDCELWIAGEGVQRQQVEERINALDLRKRVSLLGVRDDVPKLLEQVDCFVMSSIWEGLPMALLEAGAVGLPVVATPVGAIPDVISDGCGYLANIDELGRAMDAILDSYDDAILCGARLHERILDRFSLERMAEEHAALYDSINGETAKIEYRKYLG